MQSTQQQADDSRRLLKPANIVKWYREIKGLPPTTPLPPRVTYSDMLKAVLEHDESLTIAPPAEQSVA